MARFSHRRPLSFVLLAAIGSNACRSTALDAGTTGPDPGDPIQGPKPVGEDPPHVFKPRPHRPHTRPQVPPPPALASLPRLVDHSARCYGRPDTEQQPAIAGGPRKPQPFPKVARRSKNGGGHGYGSGAGGLAPSSSAPTGGAPGLGDLGGQGKGSVGSSSGRGAPSTPAPTPASPPPASKRADKAAEGWAAPQADAAPKDATRSRGEKKKESHKPAEAAEPSSASAPAIAQEEREAPSRDDRALAKDEDRDQAQLAEEESPDRYHDWGSKLYLSNDDTMSLSSAQRIIYAIERFLPLPIEHIRPHELLNYFSFETAEVAPDNDFSVTAEIAPAAESGLYTLAMSVAGRPMTLENRRNANLTFVVDRSGSMSDEGRMNYLKRGLMRSLDQLKHGDIVNLVLFDHEVCTPIQNFVVGRDPRPMLEKAIKRMEPRGSTDVHAGLREGYEVGDRAYQPTYSNRVVLVTDALANTGVTDTDMIAMIGKYYDSRRMRLSGVGVGTEFNDELLDKLTERGKGAYVFLGSEAEVDAVFGGRFVSLIETTANDVHFQLHLPPSLRMNVFYGEESSVDKQDVQAIHYFANTSQLFLSDVMARNGRLRSDDQVMLTIEYEHPETGEDLVEEYAFRLGDVAEHQRNGRKGKMIMRFVDGLAWTAARGVSGGTAPGSWIDHDSSGACEQGTADLRDMAVGLDGDAEVRKILGLWDKYCSRYERPRNPVRRHPGDAPQDRWPGAR